MEEHEYPVMNEDGIRLLLVDDDINLLELTSQLLYRKGYLVTPVTGSSEAITILNNNHRAYDVVVTDLCMLENDRIEFAIITKAISADIPVIMHTGKIDLIDETQIARAGIAEVITKPYRVEELDEIIKRVLKNRRQ